MMDCPRSTESKAVDYMRNLNTIHVIFFVRAECSVRPTRKKKLEALYVESCYQVHALKNELH